MPCNAVSTHAEALQFNYQGTPFEPLCGTGQGSGASPAAWLSLAVLLLLTLDRLVPERMEFSLPHFQHSRLIDAFVEDTSLGFTDSGVLLSCADMIDRLSTIAQHWEKLLVYSGGSSNLKKCSWYIICIGTGATVVCLSVQWQ
jgi:hypothetical protein